MSRGLSGAMQTAITVKVVRPALLVYLNFVSGPVYMWSGQGTISWNGHDFIGAGKFGGVSPITESKKISANGMQLSLSGVPTEAIADALTLNRGRAAKAWRAYFADDGTTIVSSPYQNFGGFINSIKILDSGETSKITVLLETRMIDLNRPRTRLWTSEQQKSEHPTDLAFDFVAGLQNQTLPWGQPGSTGVTQTPSAMLVAALKGKGEILS